MSGFFLVRKARQLRTVRIVSWDWLEDSLMKGRALKEFEYLLAPLIKCAKEAKEKKKAVRRENIRKGSKSFKEKRWTVFVSGIVTSLTANRASGEIRERM